ncbi:hypothetical protein GLA29479_4199 [Lysobacter antibioticus]|nr:hypothetical protein GLA29479_4199 [Lysobacter antibioticus]
MKRNSPQFRQAPVAATSTTDSNRQTGQDPAGFFTPPAFARHC